MMIEGRKKKAARKLSEKPASRKAPPSRSAGKKGTGDKAAAKKRSPPGMFSKAKHMVGAVLMGPATGAVTGAVKGAVEAGTRKDPRRKEKE